MNEDDLESILNLLHEKKCFIYNAKKIKIDEVMAIANEYLKIYIGFGDDCFIEFSPSYFAGNYLQEAVFYIRDKENEVLWKIFNDIKKYIRQTYMLSKDKSYYIGPGFYKDWLDKKYCVPSLFQYEEVFVDKNDLKDLFEFLLKSGYRIKTNNVRLRNIDIIDWQADAFIIYTESSELITTIIRKTMISYEYGADCIFVFKKPKLKGYVFQLDKRVSDDVDSKIRLLFQRIKESEWVKKQ